MTERIRISLPKSFSFQTEIPIRVTDLNYGNHLGNDSVLTLVHEARVRFLIHHKWSEFDIEGIGLVLSDAAIVYKAQGRYGQILVFEVAVGNFSKTACDFFFRITDQKTGKEVARAKTGAVFFDYSISRPVSVPKAFLKQLGN